MSSQVTLQAIGLNYNFNRLNLPSGSLIVANDVVIGRSNVIESRRGFSEYSASIGINTDITKQLMSYKSRLIAHYSNKLAYDSLVLNDDNKSKFENFSGNYIEAQVGLRTKYIESNKNLYFTSSEGIKKISAKSADDFTTNSGFIKNAGAIKALDFSATLDLNQGQISGFLPKDSAVAYRVVWGYKDRNDNLLLGSPSDRLVVYNYLSDLITLDLNNFCVVLDNLNQTGSIITDGNYYSNFSTTVNSSADTFQANLINLGKKIDNDIKLGSISGSPLIISNVAVTSNVATITFSSGNPLDYISIGDILEIKNLNTPADVANGNRLITNVTATTIEFSLITTNFTTVPTVGDIYSYAYRNITLTGDDSYSQPLDTLIISSPPTSEQLRIIQNTLFRMIERLKIEKTGIISAPLLTSYVTPFVLTESANAKLVITIPPSIDSDYFVQVYRTRTFTADGVQTLSGSTGIPVEPDDEMRLVFEGFPTSTEISSGFKVFNDNYPEDLILNNTNLYTNPVSGEGILQANDAPPFAKDIARFKNYTFYINTRTKFRIPIFQLLGVANIVSGDKITIANESVSQTYTFVSGVAEQSAFDCVAVTAPDAGKYFVFYSSNDLVKYYFYLKVDGIGTAPIFTDGKIIPIDLLSTDTNIQVAAKVAAVIGSQILDFTASNTSNTVYVTNIDQGPTTNSLSGTSPFTGFTILVDGQGESAINKQVLLSTNISAAQAIDETARSLVRVINKQSTSPVAAYYVSGENTPPGQITLESLILDSNPFYIQASADGIGTSFNPDISPYNTNITANSIATNTVITTSTSHGLLNGDKIIISNSNSTPSIDGVHTVSVISSTTFSIPVNVTVAGTQGSWSKTTDIILASNEIKPNRIYYSKIGQPEAVPLLNYLDFGAEDKVILRGFPLRDTLFIFKEDGLYRVSGESAPFVNSLFDSSCILLAPDSLDVVNNMLYGWTVKGISNISETGVSDISGPMEEEITRLSSAKFSKFKTMTWGVGYDSDNSYTVYTNSETTDTVPTFAFRYSTITNTWTNVVRSENCGLIFSKDDKMYTGSGKLNLIHKERKNFDRTDYSDKDFEITLAGGNYFNKGRSLKFTSISGIEIGDVITQEQTLTTFKFNSLLSKLDNDPSVGAAPILSSAQLGLVLTVNTSIPHTLVTGNYIKFVGTTPSIESEYQVTVVSPTTFTVVLNSIITPPTAGQIKYSYEKNHLANGGDNLRTKIVALASRLDLDPGTLGTDYFDRIDSKTVSISYNEAGSSSIVHTLSVHELIDGRLVTITGTQTPDSIPSITNSSFIVSNTGTFGSSTTFTIPIAINTQGGTGLTASTAANLNSFQDIKACFNDIVNKLNFDNGVTFSNYSLITETTLFESVVLGLDKINNKLTTNLPLELVVGPITVYKSINCQIQYAPETFQDPLGMKQIYEATAMFENRALTKFNLEFSSDLKPEFSKIEFTGQGNGIFGHYSDPGFGSGFFGGASNSAPFRTIVPRDCQRCRFINLRFTHKIAREIFSLYGITLTGNIGLSTRAYR